MTRQKSSLSRSVLQGRRRLFSSLLGHRVTKNRSYHLSSSFDPVITRKHTIIPFDQPDDAELSYKGEPSSQRQAEIERELQLARDIQQGLLLAAVPYLPGWELSAVSLPAHDLGGDLYDFLSFDNNTQGLMIGDVAGKGLPAALQMAVTRTVFRHEAKQGNPAAATLASVNRGVLSEIPQGMVTMLYALLDPANGVLQIANAGHTFPILVNGHVQELEITGLPLGIDNDVVYDEFNIMLEPGDTIVFYSDGATEAFNEELEMFGLERLQHTLATYSLLKPRALMTKLLHDIRAWGTGPGDDLTIVLLRRRLAQLGDELHSIFHDVLGEERARLFWSDITGNLRMTFVQDATCDEWNELLPTILRTAQARFGRGLARELTQQLRLVIEEYR